MTSSIEVKFHCAKCNQVNVALYEPPVQVASGARTDDGKRFFKCANPDCGQWNGVELPHDQAKG